MTDPITAFGPLKPTADDYDAAADSAGSYYAAVEAKRLRGDTHWTRRQAGVDAPAPASTNPVKPGEEQSP